MTFLVRPHVSGGRGFSRSLWNLSRLAEISMDPDAGFFFCDDFLDLPTGRYTATQATAGTFALTDADGGVVIADSNSTTDTQGINVQLGGTAGEMILPEADTEIWFEARVKVHDFGTAGAGIQFFLGLSETDTTIIASSANSSANHIGFEAIATDSVTGVSEKATTRGTVSSLTTLIDSDVTADSWVKLGFHVKGVDTLTFYVDGTANGTTIATTNIPAVELRPSIVVQTDGASTDPLAHMDWWAVAKSFRIG